MTGTRKLSTVHQLEIDKILGEKNPGGRWDNSAHKESESVLYGGDRAPSLYSNINQQQSGTHSKWYDIMIPIDLARIQLMMARLLEKEPERMSWTEIPEPDF